MSLSKSNEKDTISLCNCKLTNRSATINRADKIVKIVFFFWFSFQQLNF